MAVQCIAVHCIALHCITYKHTHIHICIYTCIEREREREQDVLVYGTPDLRDNRPPCRNASGHKKLSLPDGRSQDPYGSFFVFEVDTALICLDGVMHCCVF